MGQPEVGLCGDCRWARRVTSSRGSIFVLCRRARTDRAYPKYPPLPRLQCRGHEPGGLPGHPGLGSRPGPTG